MKIVHLMSTYIPNMGYQENFLPLEQQKLNHEVEIICCSKISKEFEHVLGFDNNSSLKIGAYNDNGIKIHRLKCHGIKGGLYFLKDLKKKLKEIKPDIVQAHGTSSVITLQAIFWSKKLNYKVFVDDHSNENNFYPDLAVKKPFKYIYDFFGEKIIRFMPTVFPMLLFYKIYGNRIQKIMPVTYSAENYLLNVWNFPTEKLSISHLGVNTDLFYKSNNLRNLGRKKIDIDENEFLILTSGKLGKHKDIDILLYSFQIVSKKYPQSKLLILGSASQTYISYLKKLINKLKLNKKVLFKDFVTNSDLPIYYNAADIGVWPGHHSITVIEALGTTLPIIIPNNILAYKILTENKAALSFERGNIEMLANQILELIENNELRNLVRFNADYLTKNTLSWSKIAEKSISIYLEEV